ncbi:F-box protein SKIP28-like [Nicotiana tabacum]|uniref:F-box protein SKIP28-like n=1 Tax=Nicotiana tabacum TaxID=4097 RepID=A0A1S3XL64_TOBAC|nr:PREDICTED: F-box protein SKIP28-like [Nicotiana tabacum]
MDMQISQPIPEGEELNTGTAMIKIPLESGEPPHEAMFLVLPYLPLFELLSMTQVCRSLRDALKDDILPWLNIVVEKPLNTRLSDDFLMKVTSKANSRLRVVALINCIKITDDGLLQVITSNPHISKLYLPGCTGLTIEGVLGAVKFLTKANHRLKSLSISGIYNVKREDFETLCHLMGINQIQKKDGKNFYQKRSKPSTLRQESQPSIDIDVCLKCGEIREIFDCPKNSCERRKQQQLVECRGCFLCIPRCEECGVCTKDEEVGEAACADILCLDCWLQLPKCSFCNKAYCNQHAYQQSLLSGSSGFLCSDCNFRSTQSSPY